MKCRLCGSSKTFELSRLKGVPKAAQWMPAAHQLTNDHPMELRICQCKNCSLVQLDNAPVSYYKDVITTHSLNKHARAALKSELLKFISLLPKQKLTALEIGCGQGGYLPILEDLNFVSTGIEHSTSNVELATAAGLNVVQGYLTDYDERELASLGTFLFIIINNFLEHQPDISSFLSRVYDLLEEGGILYVSVPSLERIEEKNCLQEFVADHLVYFTKETLHRALGNSGFEVFHCYQKNSGNDLVALAKKRPVKCYREMEDQFLKSSKAVATFVSKKSAAGETIAVWGAGHRALTFMAISDLQDVSFVIDSAEFKQGRLTPLLHRKIISPSEIDALGISIIVLMLPGSLNEAVSKLLTSDLRFSGEIYCFDDHQLMRLED